MQETKTRYGCPICRESGKKSQIIARNRQLACSENSQHVWFDIQSFRELSPSVEFSEAMVAPAVQKDWVSISVNLPKRIKEGIDKIHGQNLNTVISEVLDALSRGQGMVVDSEDLTRIARAANLRETPSSASEIVGIIFSLTQQIADLQIERDASIADLKAYESRSEGRVVVDLGRNYQKIVDLARSSNEPIKMFVERNMNNAIENDWFS